MTARIVERFAWLMHAPWYLCLSLMDSYSTSTHFHPSFSLHSRRCNRNAYPSASLARHTARHSELRPPAALFAPSDSAHTDPKMSAAAAGGPDPLQMAPLPSASDSEAGAATQNGTQAEQNNARGIPTNATEQAWR